MKKLALRFWMVFSSAILGVAASQAADLQLYSNPGLQPAIAKIIVAFEQSAGIKINQVVLLSAAMKRRLDSGEAFDVAILTPPALADDLAKTGKAIAETKKEFVRVGVALGVKAGRTVDLSTVESFKRELLNAKTIAWSKDAAAAIYFDQLIGQLGMRDQLEARMKAMGPGEPAICVAAGQCDFSVGLTTDGVDGMQMALFPAEVGRFQIQAAIVGTAGANRTGAINFVNFLGSPDATRLIKSIPGLQPLGQ